MSELPLRYAHGNILFGLTGERAALFRLETVSYPFLPRSEKVRWFERLAHWLYSCESDLSLWRVQRAYPAERYLADSAALLDERYADRPRWNAYVGRHTEVVRAARAFVPDFYVAVALRTEPSGPGRSLLVSADRARRRVERVFGTAGRRPVLASELRQLVAAEERAYARLAGLLPARRATTGELQWLLRRAAVRGVAEPRLDLAWQPNALLAQSEDGELAYEPLATGVSRLAGAAVLEEERTLVVDGEEARSHQAFLTLGALPAEVAFPGPRAELLSAPLEALEFPVDAVFHARWVGNRQALARVRRRVVDSDNVFADELESSQGPSWAADDARGLARELHAYLEAEARPPLLHATVSLAIGASTREELERRVERLRAAYGTVALHRPHGLQPALFLDHLPRADGGEVWEYGDYLTVEQAAALMPLATHQVGTRTGVYLGTSGQGSRRPVLFDIAAASREGRPPSILLAGTLGSGKTIAAELLALQAALRGALVVDVDPKPDHNLERLPALEGLVEVVELSGSDRFRGMLDPLRVAPPSLREDLTSSVLMELLPQAPPAWETQVRKAVRDAIRSGAESSLAILELLAASNHSHAREAGEALAVWADSGLARLAFATGPASAVQPACPVTSIKASALTLPSPGTARADYTQAERLAVAVLTLVAAYALRLVSGDRSRLKLLLFDEAWFLLTSSEGRRLLDRLNRLGRSENATLVLATQQLGDVGEIENLIGTRLIFGQETGAEAERALALLGLDPSDRDLVQRLRSYRRGRCLMRDLDDRIAEVQIDPADPEVLAALDTTPGEWPPAEALH
jgi:hypothetical protein